MRDLNFLALAFSDDETCSYLPNETARMPMYLSRGEISPKQFDQLLAAGFRRNGSFYYYTRCPNCSACEPLRLEAAAFRPSRSQRRAQKLGEKHFRVQVAEPTIDSQRIHLFNRHQTERGLNHRREELVETDYRSFFMSRHLTVLELSLWVEDRLVAVSITDVGEESFSAVYCFFDPDFAWLAPGTYAILQQIELTRSTGRRWLYLGMFVAENSHLRYKAKYRPHERLIKGVWTSSEEDLN